MMKRSRLASVGVVVLLVGCAGNPDQKQSQNSPSPNAPQTAAPPAKNQFSKPVVAPMPIVEVPAVPGLLKPTNAQSRLPMIQTGRRADPFAGLTPGTIALPVAAARRSTAPATQRPSAVSLVPLPPGLPALPSVAAPSAPLPPATPPIPVSPTATADAIDITGVIQVKGKWHVIVKEPNAESSRYVGAGDYLANGTVLVKRIVAGGGAEPIVVLQQNGAEITRSIGSAGTMAQRL